MIRKDFEAIALKLEEDGFVKVNNRSSFAKETEINKKRYFVEIGYPELSEKEEVGVVINCPGEVNYITIFSTTIKDVDCLANSTLSVYIYFNNLFGYQHLFNLTIRGFVYGKNSISPKYGDISWPPIRKSARIEGSRVDHSFEFFLEEDFEKSYISQIQTSSYVESRTNKSVKSILGL